LSFSTDEEVVLCFGICCWRLSVTRKIYAQACILGQLPAIPACDSEPPSIAQGGKGVVVPGCPACKKRINTTSQFLDHLAYDAIPPLIDRLSILKDSP
jgi:hypothetical protein